MIRNINVDEITKNIKEMCIEANHFLTEDMKELTGGQVIINDDAKASADILEQIILEKRQGLQI
mgnify:CR=1 FL=1